MQDFCLFLLIFLRLIYVLHIREFQMLINKTFDFCLIKVIMKRLKFIKYKTNKPVTPISSRQR